MSGGGEPQPQARRSRPCLLLPTLTLISLPGAMQLRLRLEDHDPEQVRKVLDTAKRQELASFIQAAFGIVNPEVEYKHNYHIEAIAHRLWFRRHILVAPNFTRVIGAARPAHNHEAHIMPF